MQRQTCFGKQRNFEAHLLQQKWCRRLQDKLFIFLVLKHQHNITSWRKINNTTSFCVFVTASICTCVGSAHCLCLLYAWSSCNARWPLGGAWSSSQTGVLWTGSTHQKSTDTVYCNSKALCQTTKCQFNRKSAKSCIINNFLWPQTTKAAVHNLLSSSGVIQRHKKKANKELWVMYGNSCYDLWVEGKLSHPFSTSVACSTIISY